MTAAIELNRLARVNRPRSKYHDCVGSVSAIAVSPGSHGGVFHWRVTIIDDYGDGKPIATVPLSYVEVHEDGAWVPAHDLDDNPPEPCHD